MAGARKRRPVACATCTYMPIDSRRAWGRSIARLSETIGMASSWWRRAEANISLGTAEGVTRVRRCAVPFLMLVRKDGHRQSNKQERRYKIHTPGYPTISILAKLCLPRSGPAVTGAGDLAAICSGAGSKIPLLANEG